VDGAGWPLPLLAQAASESAIKDAAMARRPSLLIAPPGKEHFGS
jgi:hypothetical protein